MDKIINKNSHKPNFFIVGAPKCGTTSLYYYLKQHPEIFMSEVKEPNYFCKDFHLEAENYLGGRNISFRYKNENDYLKIFKNVKKGKEIIGEASVRYYFSKVTAKEIYKFNPDAKIIIMLREPINIMKSQHAQLLKSGHETINNFSEAINMEDERKKGTNVPHNIDQPSLLYYKELGKFKINLNRYLNLFPKKNIKIILLDDLKNDKINIYKEILNFLDVKSKDFIPNFDIKNSRGLPRFKFITSFFRNDSILKKIIRKIISHKNREKLYYFIEKLNTKKIEGALNNKINKELEIKLKNEFYNDVEFIENILDKKLLTKWGYKNE